MSQDLTEIELHLAIQTKNYAAVSHLLQNGSNPNAVLKRSFYPDKIIKHFKVDLWTPLHCAAHIQDEKIVKLLIKYNADVNLEDEYGRTPINIAASRGNVNIVKLLLESGAYVDSTMVHKNDSDKSVLRIREPLHAAVESHSFEVTKILVENKANLNLTDRWSRTSLFLSILEGNDDIVELLLDNGADIKGSINPMEKNTEKTALHHIAEQLQIKIMKLLSTKYENKFSETQRILDLCFYRNFNDINFMIEERYQNVIEIIKKHDKILRILLKHDVNINATDINGFSPLHSAIREGNWRTAKTLLENGADVDLQEKLGRTPLHLALLHQRRALVEILLNYEANFLIADCEGLTPLNYQCQFCPDFDLESHVVRIEILKMTEKEYFTQDVLSYYERLCLEEIFDLKNNYFSFGTFSFSFYQIFIDSPKRRLVRLSRNNEFCNEVSSEGFYNKFSIYGDILRGRLDKAIYRSNLINKSLQPLNYILGIELPQLVLELIFSYLDNTDITNIMELYKSLIKNIIL